MPTCHDVVPVYKLLLDAPEVRTIGSSEANLFYVCKWERFALIKAKKAKAIRGNYEINVVQKNLCFPSRIKDNALAKLLCFLPGNRLSLVILGINVHNVPK
jgi:hypothetical protein